MSALTAAFWVVSIGGLAFAAAHALPTSPTRLAVLAILGTAKVAVALLVLGVPIIVTFWIIVRRVSEGRSPFSPDRTHIHHRLLDLGLSHRQTVLVIYGICLALAVLSGIEPEELVRAVREGDVARLTKIPGVGKKTAERIGLELKDRLPLTFGLAERPAPSDADQLRGDVLSALTNLGYQSNAAEQALDKVFAATPDAAFETALRGALKALMRP